MTTDMSQQWLANPASMEWPAGSDGRVEEYMATFLAKGWVATGPGRTYETWVGKLAAFLLKSFGVTDPPKNARFNGFPEGYILFSSAREPPKDPNMKQRVDQYLGGHPSGKDFKSPADASVHFIHHVHEDSGDCPCKLCGTYKKAPPRIESDIKGDPPKYGTRPERNPKATILQAGIPYGKVPVDWNRVSHGQGGEGPHVVKEGYQVVGGRFQATQRNGPVNDAFAGHQDFILQELFNAIQAIDIPAPLLNEYRSRITESVEQMLEQPAILPRLGEVVLYTEDKRVLLDKSTGVYKTQLASDKYIGIKWEAGLVTKVHKVEADIMKTRITVDRLAIRDDARYQQARWTTTLSHIRPMALIGETLGTHKAIMGESVEAAHTIFGRFALCGPLEYAGMSEDNKRAIFGIESLWFGAELLLVGDAVRLFTRENNPNITRVLVVDGIHLEFELVRGMWDNPRIIVFGRAYDDHPNAFTRAKPFSDLAFLPLVMHGGQNKDGEYLGGTWYPFFDGIVTNAIDDDQNQPTYFHAEINTVVGRLHEPVEVQRLCGYQHFSYGQMIKNFRHQQSIENADLMDMAPGLFLGENRADSMGLHYFDQQLIGPGLRLHTDKTFPWKHVQRQYWTPEFQAKAATKAKPTADMPAEPLITASNVAGDTNLRAMHANVTNGTGALDKHGTPGAGESRGVEMFDRGTISNYQSNGGQDIAESDRHGSHAQHFANGAGHGPNNRGSFNKMADQGMADEMSSIRLDKEKGKTVNQSFPGFVEDFGDAEMSDS